MNGTDNKPAKLDARTWVPIGLLASLLLTAIYGTAYIVSQAGDFKGTQATLVTGQADLSKATSENTGALRELTESMLMMRRDLTDVTNDRWRATDMRYLWLATQQAFDRAGVKVDLPPVTTLDAHSPGGGNGNK